MGVAIEGFGQVGWHHLCFRLFDIFKPGIIGRFDKGTSALSVMLDDVFAGILPPLVYLS